MLFRTLVSRALFAACLAPALQAAPTGKVWTVGASGADFTQIQPAVDAAADGDLILVKPGSYAQFAISGRSLTVFAKQPGFVSIAGAVRIMNLAPGQRVTLIDLSAAGNEEHALRLAENQGAVRIRGGTWTGMNVSAAALGNDAVHATHCADLALSGCTLQGGAGVFASSHNGGAGLRARESAIALYDCTVEGGDGSSGASGSVGKAGFHGGAGARIEGGFLFASNSSFAGGNGGEGGESSFLNQGGAGGAGGDGLEIFGEPDLGLGQAAQIELLAVTPTGGAGGWGGFSNGGWGSNGPAGEPLVASGQVNVQTLAGPLHRFATDGVWKPGLPEILTFSGQPGEQVFLVISAKTGFQWIAAKQGVLLVGGLPALKYVGQLDAQGSLTRTFAPGGLPGGWDGSTLQLQAWMAIPGSAGTLTGPSTTALIAPGF